MYRRHTLFQLSQHFLRHRTTQVRRRRSISNQFNINKNSEYTIRAKAYGEPLDFEKHNFKVEIKAPTFYEMKIEQNDGVFMRFLLDL